jgi:hypothetical protein
MVFCSILMLASFARICEYSLPPSPMSDLRWNTAIERGGIWKILLTRIKLFSYHQPHPLLHKPLACGACFLAHHLTHHLAGKAISIESSHFLHTFPLTEQPALYQILQSL